MAVGQTSAPTRSSKPKPKKSAQKHVNLNVSSEFKAVSYGGIAFLITLRNTGLRPVFVERIDLYLNSGDRLPYKDQHGFLLKEPIRVTEEKPETILFALHEYMKQLGSPLNVTRVEVHDTHGRLYTYPSGSAAARRFKTQITQEWTTENQEYWAGKK